MDSIKFSKTKGTDYVWLISRTVVIYMLGILVYTAASLIISTDKTNVGSGKTCFP